MKRVLLLEDSDSLARSIVAALEVEGHAVSRFRDLREARAAVPPIGFDVLLCDYELPDGTGIGLLAEVEDSTPLGLAKWTTILWSGVDRAAEVAESGLAIDHVLVKSGGTARAVIDIIAGDAPEQ